MRGCGTNGASYRRPVQPSHCDGTNTHSLSLLTDNATIVKHCSILRRHTYSLFLSLSPSLAHQLRHAMHFPSSSSSRASLFLLLSLDPSLRLSGKSTSGEEETRKSERDEQQEYRRTCIRGRNQTGKREERDLMMMSGRSSGDDGNN